MNESKTSQAYALVLLHTAVEEVRRSGLRAIALNVGRELHIKVLGAHVIYSSDEEQFVLTEGDDEH